MNRCLIARPLRVICAPIARRSPLHPEPFCLRHTRPALLSNRRSFAHTPALYRKNRKPRNDAASEPEPASATRVVDEDGDPISFKPFHTDMDAAVERLKDDLSKLRAGGRFSTATLEGLRVQLSKDSKDAVRLGDLAQVVPKGGRTVTILAAEDDHIKPITSAIISSNLSLTPQPDPHNALQLNISVPPPTKESRDQSVNTAKQAFEKAANSVRDARGVMHKRLQEMQKKKVARPDDVRKAHDKMEKTTNQNQKRVKELFEAAKRTLEQA